MSNCHNCQYFCDCYENKVSYPEECRRINGGENKYRIHLLGILARMIRGVLAK